MVKSLQNDISVQPIEIQIFGRTLRVNCPMQKQGALNSAAEDLNKRLQTLKVKTKVTNMEQLVSIVALNVCHELAEEKIKINKYTADLEQRIRLLQQTIEQALNKKKNI